MTNYDKILIAVVALFSLTGMYLSKNSIKSSDSKYVYIEVDGSPYKEIVFDEDTEITTAIDSKHGHNELLIKDGKVKMIDADCNDQICVKESAISEVGEVNVCLPNRTLVEIRGVDLENEVDYISH